MGGTAPKRAGRGGAHGDGMALLGRKKGFVRGINFGRPAPMRAGVGCFFLCSGSHKGLKLYNYYSGRFFLDQPRRRGKGAGGGARGEVVSE